MRVMKDSGIEWIGEIPKVWSLNKIGSIYQERNVKVSDVDYKALSVTKQGIVPQLGSAAKSDNNDNRKLILKKDFVINSRSDRRGSCGISEFDGSCSLINIVLEPKGQMNNRYYSYVFKSEQFADEFYRYGNGIVADLWSTKWSSMKRIYIPSPSLEEQQRIASYLDSKCSTIDSIVAKQQQLIEKLKEYKQAVITEAVTKGLNPDVPMKDSDIEWIGEIPEHWEFTKIKYLLENTRDSLRVGPFGSSLSGSDIVSEGYWVYNQRTVIDNNFETNDSFVTAEKYNELTSFAVSPGDILITTRGSVGKVAIVPDDAPKGILHPCIIKFKLDETKILKGYLKLVFNDTVLGVEQVIRKSNSTTIEVLYSYALKNIGVPLPTLNEQKIILSRMNAFKKDVNRMIYCRHQIITKLQEYKKSLIYEVVTGKREVPDA